MPTINNNVEGCASVTQISSNTNCLLELSTTPSLQGLPTEAGTITVDLIFLRGTTGWEASSPAGGFLTTPSSGASTSFTISYEQNTAAAPRTDTLIITPTGSGAIVTPLRLLVIQHGTANAIIGDVVLDSVEAITEEIREAQYIVGNLLISDGEPGEDLDNHHLRGLQVETITGSLRIRRTKIRKLDAFASLRTIEGHLDIGRQNFSDGNRMMLSMSGFDALDSIGGGLYMEANDELVTITAFRRLRRIEGHLIIRYNNGITAISSPAFERLSSIGQRLIIRNNRELVSLPTFSCFLRLGA